MRYDRLTDQFCELAALYAFGMLPADEALSFESHLAGCEACKGEVAAFRESAAAMTLAEEPRAPHPRVREQLMARIGAAPGASGIQVWREWTGSTGPDIHVVKAPQGEWQTVREGVRVKQLYADPTADSVTMLIRMEPGSSYPAHRHAGPEQCFVLEGDVRASGIQLKAGDYQCATTASTHDVTTTEQGCLLLIVSSRHDQLIG